MSTHTQLGHRNEAEHRAELQRIRTVVARACLEDNLGPAATRYDEHAKGLCDCVLALAPLTFARALGEIQTEHKYAWEVAERSAQSNRRIA